MPSTALVPTLAVINGNVTADQRVPGALVDTNYASLRNTINDLLVALRTSIRDDNTLVDHLVRLRNLHPEVLDYIRANGGSGGGGGGSLGLSVKAEAFGAVGDGTTDDTDAIQACIDAVHTQGGGVVYFPAGTYLVRVAQTASATWKHCLRIYANITLRGESRESSTIKLKNSAGNYWSIFARALSTDTDMNDVGIYDLCIDQNNTNNAPAALSDLTSGGGARFVLVCYGGHRVTVRNCRFKDFKSINTLTFNGPVGLVYDIQVTGNLFEPGASASLNNDHSTIYTSAAEVTIAYNQFISPAKNTYGATTAIEVHGSNQVITGNVIKNYLLGMNVTGVATASDNVSVRGNVIDGCRYGIQLWSWFSGGNLTLPALTNCTVAGNVIRIDRDAWTVSLQVSFGIGFDTVGTAPVRGLKIDGNFIYFEVTAVGISQDNLCAGIMTLRGLGGALGGVGYDEAFDITNNTIINAIGAGIDLRTPCHGLRCIGNTVVNCGRSTYGALAAAFRSGILIFPTLHQAWEISNNLLIDDQATVTMVQGVTIGTAQAVECRMKGNTWRCPNKVNGVNYPIIATGVAGAGWYVTQEFDSYSVSFGFAGQFKPGSQAIDLATGTKYTQVIAPQGATYVAETPTSYPATQAAIGAAAGTGALETFADCRYTAGNWIIGGTLSGILWANGPAGTQRGFRFATAGSQRALLTVDGAEGGADAGANIGLATYTDGAVFIDWAVYITRKAGGTVQINRPLQINSGLSPFQTILAASSTLTHTQSWVNYTGTGGDVFTAPSAAAIGASRPWFQWVKNRGTGVLLYRRAGADTIDGNTADVEIQPGDAVLFIANGSSDILIASRAMGDQRVFTRVLRGVNLNSGATDVGTISRLPTSYRVRRVTVKNASISLTTATFSLRNAAGGGGTAIVAAAGLAALTTASKVTEPAIASTDVFVATTLTIRNDTAQGAAATADFIIEIEDMR